MVLLKCFVLCVLCDFSAEKSGSSDMSNYNNGTFSENLFWVFWVVPVSRVKKEVIGDRDMKYRQYQTFQVWSFNYNALTL